VTCIVGVQHEGKVWIGGDSAGVAGMGIQTRADVKVFRRGPYAMGFAGSFRMGQLLRYNAELSIPSVAEVPDRDLDAFMVSIFVEEVRKTLRKGGHTYVENNSETLGGLFLVGVRGVLYAIDCDLQIGRTRDGYQAIGCGDDLALGSLHATRLDTSWMHPRYRVRKALDAAAHHSAGVCKPFKVVSA
jgi:ATP-dependent protease HslVU (ClpYQ) peptidase subunit